VVSTRKQLNFIEGSSVTLTIADDAGNNQTDITINSTAVGGGAISALDEGGLLTATVTSFDFVGAGVTATNIVGAVTVTIPRQDEISVNGSAATDADFDDATPAPPTGGQNVFWQKDAGTPNNISAYIKPWGDLLAAKFARP
jgi:hypothetical protein